MRPVYAPAIVFCIFGGIAACNAVLDIPEAGHLGPDASASSSTSSSGASGKTSSSTSSSGSGNCPTGHKNCDGACVPNDNPKTGCAQDGCDPCKLANANAQCGDDGTCQIENCSDGFKDCNGKAPDGCEIDINNDTANCGDCDNPCAGSLTCQNAGCGCDLTVQCGIDTNGGTDGQISCVQGRLCMCFGDTCDPGNNCDIPNSACN